MAPKILEKDGSIALSVDFMFATVKVIKACEERDFRTEEILYKLRVRYDTHKRLERRRR